MPTPEYRFSRYREQVHRKQRFWFLLIGVWSTALVFAIAFVIYLQFSWTLMVVLVLLGAGIDVLIYREIQDNTNELETMINWELHRIFDEEDDN